MSARSKKSLKIEFCSRLSSILFDEVDRSLVEKLFLLPHYSIQLDDALATASQECYSIYDQDTRYN